MMNATFGHLLGVAYAVRRRPAQVRRRRAPALLRRRRATTARRPRRVRDAADAARDRPAADVGRRGDAPHARRPQQRPLPVLPRRRLAPRADRQRARRPRTVGSRTPPRPATSCSRRRPPRRSRARELGEAKGGGVLLPRAGRRDARQRAAARRRRARARACRAGRRARRHVATGARRAGAPPGRRRVRPLRRRRCAARSGGREAPRAAVRRARAAVQAAVGEHERHVPRERRRPRRRPHRARRGRAADRGRRRGPPAPDRARDRRRRVVAPGPRRRQPRARLRGRGRRAVPADVHHPRRHRRARGAADGAGAPGRDPRRGGRARAVAHRFETAELEPFRVKGKSLPVHRVASSAPSAGTPRLGVRGSSRSSIAQRELAMLGAALAPARAGFGSSRRARRRHRDRQVAARRGAPRQCADMTQTTRGRASRTTPRRRTAPSATCCAGCSTSSCDGAPEQNTKRLRARLAPAAPELVPWIPLLALPLDIEVAADAARRTSSSRRSGVRGCTASSGRCSRRSSLAGAARVRGRALAGRSVVGPAPPPRHAGRTPAWLVCRDPPCPGRRRLLRRRGHAAAAALTMRLEPLPPTTRARSSPPPRPARLRAHEVEAIVERAGGNPLFLQELVAATGRRRRAAKSCPRASRRS